MSNELLSQFNQVLRPYYAQMTRPGIEDNAALLEFMARFSADQSLVELLADASPEVKALQEQLSADNVTVLGHYLKTRLFSIQMAPALAKTIIAQWPRSEFATLAQTLEQKIKAPVDGNTLGLHELPLQRLLTALYASFAQQNLEQETKIKDAPLIQGKCNNAVDVNSSALSAKIFSCAKVKTLYSIAANPEQVTLLHRNSALASCVKQHVIFKTILGPVSDQRVFFDQQGRGYLNRMPMGSNPLSFFLTRSFAILLKDTKADLVKFTLTPESLNLFTASENAKYLNKHQVQLLVQLEQPQESELSLNLTTEFAFLSPLSQLLEFLQGLRKVSYTMQLHYSSTSFDTLLVSCHCTSADKTLRKLS